MANETTKKKKTKTDETVETEATVTATSEETKAAAPRSTVRRVKKVSTATEQAELPMSKGAYIFGLGRRKSSIARVRLMKNGKGALKINGRNFDDYFSTFELRFILTNPLKIVGQEGAVDIIADVEGGGLRGQAEAVRLGMSRALVVLNPTYRKTLKKLGYLSRDPRVKERKKPGLKRARRAPQWSKR